MLLDLLGGDLRGGCVRGDARAAGDKGGLVYYSGDVGSIICARDECVGAADDGWSEKRVCRQRVD